MNLRRAFTLVELLVVIGIIAVLIGIILPALSGARRSGNSLRCLSNLRQMGVAVEMYSNLHKGVLPFGVWRSVGPYPATLEQQTGWGALLVATLGKGDGTWTSNTAGSTMRTLFLDSDTIDGVTAANQTMVNHYVAHPVLMPEIHLTWPAGHPLAGKRRVPYKKNKIRRASETVLLMDGTQILKFWGIPGDTHPVAYHLDGRRVVSTAAPSTFLFEDLAQKTDDAWDISIDGGPNVDAQSGPDIADLPASAPANIRWRHLGNKSANFLFVDGHAEARRYQSRFKTELKRSNIHVPRP